MTKLYFGLARAGAHRALLLAGLALVVGSPTSYSQDPATPPANEMPRLQGLVLTSKEIPEEILPAGPPKKLPTKRGPAAFSAGYRTTKTPCAYYKVPNPMAARVGTLEKGTKIWLEGVDLEWTRGVHRNHSIFVPSKCLE